VTSGLTAKIGPCNKIKKAAVRRRGVIFSPQSPGD
jgi:hypothetical protein